MLDYAHVRAVAAVIRAGSFEKAARQLGVTQSAISQRVRLIEERLGTILIIRGQPCLATPSGERLFRHAEEVALLEERLGRELGFSTGPLPILRVAVNADSLATWFVPAMAEVKECLFDLVLDDQEHSMDWLRRGEVRATVSSFAGSVQGCDSRPLGALRYIATASPAFIDRWFAQGVSLEALSRAPCVTFNAKDGLQTRWIKQVFGVEMSPPTHWLPSSQAFVDAALAGLGWNLNPEILVGEALARGDLVALVADSPVDVELHWHWSRSVGSSIAPVTAAVLNSARRLLLPTVHR